jgi:hypothetical protein
MLSELKLQPSSPRPAGGLVLRHLGWSNPVARESLLKAFFTDSFGLSTAINWEKVLGKSAHSELQRRAIVLRGHWQGNPSVFVTALDSFNDLLIQRLSLKHKLLRKPFRNLAGRNKIPNYGKWLVNGTLKSVLPKANLILKECHDLRVRAEFAHATQVRTGRFTRPVSYREQARLLRTLKPAYVELLGVFSTI